MIQYFKYIPITFILGFIVDAVVGDPRNIPHPVQLIGRLITFLEKRLLVKEDSDDKKYKKGMLLTFLVVLSTAFLGIFILYCAFLVDKEVGLIVMTVMSWQSIAAKSLCQAAMDVHEPLKDGDIEGARTAVSMIVGRDTALLDKDGITRAAVETVAENTNDGVICPMFYLAIGGPVLAFIYKAVSTMDSMIGYKNDKYMFFGRSAAKLDDIFAFVPARISAVLMMAAAFLLELTDKAHYSFKDSVRIFKRDRFNHASPNSAQCESVCAGALGLRLAGPAVYFGEMHSKPYIGDEKRKIEADDIVRACRLMYITALFPVIVYSIIEVIRIYVV